MYSHVVHIERTNIQALDVRSEDARGRAYNIRAYNAYKLNKDINLEFASLERYSEMETFYCNDIDSAEALAAKFAKECPGRAVYVLELKSVTQSSATPPVISNWSDRGLIPR